MALSFAIALPYLQERFVFSRNLFELCGAKLLVTTNSVTRSLSTKMKPLLYLAFEVFACCILFRIAIFIAAFNLGQWTFSKNTQIPRLAGSEFWHKISMDYNLVENYVRSMLQRIDKAFSKLAASERQNME